MRMTRLLPIVFLLNFADNSRIIALASEREYYQQTLKTCVMEIKKWIDGRALFTHKEALEMAESYCFYLKGDLRMDCLNKRCNYALSLPLYRSKDAVKYALNSCSFGW